MANPYIADRRLHNQHISQAAFERPADVVAWMGAVQAQDYTGALWAVALRTVGATAAEVEQAIADRAIIRTWPMRNTLHFVAAADIRWMLELLAGRVIANSEVRARWLEVDDRVLARSRGLVVRALEGGKQLRRDVMYRHLEAARIPTAGGRGLYILSRLSLEGLLCFGARDGKQPSFALLDEWVPQARTVARDEAMAELARRYFTSHGPATLPDFIWWSGLRAADARAALEMAKPHLVQEVIDGQTYWLAPSMAANGTVAGLASPTVYLLPSYDEYTVAYKDRTAVLDPVYAKQASTGNGIFYPTLVLDGQVVGTWRRALKKETVTIMLNPFERINRAEKRALAAAADRYAKFLGTPVVLA